MSAKIIPCKRWCRMMSVMISDYAAYYRVHVRHCVVCRGPIIPLHRTESVCRECEALIADAKRMRQT